MMNLQIKEGGARQVPSDANGHGVLCSLGSRGHVPTPPGPAIRHGPASTRKAKASCKGRALANSYGAYLGTFLACSSREYRRYFEAMTTVALVVGLTLAFVVGSGHRMATTRMGFRYEDIHSDRGNLGPN